jgi:hypothetical protein
VAARCERHQLQRNGFVSIWHIVANFCDFCEQKLTVSKYGCDWTHTRKLRPTNWPAVRVKLRFRLPLRPSWLSSASALVVGSWTYPTMTLNHSHPRCLPLPAFGEWLFALSSRLVSLFHAGFRPQIFDAQGCPHCGTITRLQSTEFTVRQGVRLVGLLAKSVEKLRVSVRSKLDAGYSQLTGTLPSSLGVSVGLQCVHVVGRRMCVAS